MWMKNENDNDNENEKWEWKMRMTMTMTMRMKNENENEKWEWEWEWKWKWTIKKIIFTTLFITIGLWLKIMFLALNLILSKKTQKFDECNSIEWT